MKRKKALYKIPLLLLGIFFLDKLLLIPQIRFTLTDASLLNPYRETLENNESNYQKQAQHLGKKIIWNFGTSKSFPYYYLPIPNQTLSDPFTNANEKTEIDKWYVVNFAAPGSNPIIYLTRFLQMLKRGQKPEVVFLELSEFSFNKNSNLTKYSRLEGVPLTLLLSNTKLYSKSLIYDVLVSRLFYSNRYKLSYKQFQNFIHGMKPKPTFDIQYYLDTLDKNGKEWDRQYTEDDFKDIHSSKIKFGLENDFRFKKMIELIESEFYNQYEVGMESMQTLEEIVRLARQNKIPVLFWRPKVHENLKQINVQYNIEKIWGLQIHEIAKKNDIPILDFYNGKPTLQCDFYLDAAHLSPRCYTELTAKILEAVK